VSYNDTKLDLYEASNNLDFIQNPLIKSLFQLTSVGNFVYNLFESRLTKTQAVKQKLFAEQISSSDRVITTEMIEDDEFLMNFAKTFDAVSKVAVNDKIIYFSNLLKNAYFTDEKLDADSF
jgi:hypothetical protein